MGTLNLGQSTDSHQQIKVSISVTPQASELPIPTPSPSPASTANTTPYFQTPTSEVLTSAATTAATTGAVSGDEILVSIILLSFLALIAVCLAFYCLRKHCCGRNRNLFSSGQQMEMMQQNSLNSSSVNLNSFPSIQKAVDGSQSPISSNESPSPANSITTNSSPASQERDRRRRLTGSPQPRQRVASPGRRARGLHEPEPLRRADRRNQKSTYQTIRMRAFRRSQLGPTKSRISSRIDSGPVRKDHRHPDWPVQAVEARSPQHGAGLKPVTSQIKSLAKSQVSDVRPYNKSPIQQVNLNDMPITADLINKQTKDTQKEFVLFKSPHLYE